MNVSTEDIMNKLGISVSTADIARATFMIETAVNYSLEDIESDDKRYFNLRNAVMWQTAFVVNNPELADSREATSMSANGVSMSFTPGSDTYPTWLSPLAAKALTGLPKATVGSNMGTTHVLPDDVLHRYYDDDNLVGWRPL